MARLDLGPFRFSLLVVVGLMAAGACATCSSPAAPSMPVLDQQNLLDGQTGGQFIGGNGVTTEPYDIQAAQTFTVGIAGLLSEVRIPLVNIGGQATAPVVLDIRLVVNGEPDPNAVVGSVTVPSSLIPSPAGGAEVRATPGLWPLINVRPLNVRVKVGDMLAFSVSTVDLVGYNFNPESTLGYAGGTGHFRNRAITTAWTTVGRDYGFQIYITP